MTNYGKTSYINIDGDRLRDAFEKRDLVRDQVAKELGCGCAISNAIARGKIAKPVMRLLTAEYGITQEEVALSTVAIKETLKQPQEVVIAPQINDKQWERAKDIIKAAILEVMKEKEEEVNNNEKTYQG